jgi:hypothetical protein
MLVETPPISLGILMLVHTLPITLGWASAALLMHVNTTTTAAHVHIQRGKLLAIPCIMDQFGGTCDAIVLMVVIVLSCKAKVAHMVLRNSLWTIAQFAVR